VEGDFVGTDLPTGLGDITTTNANGDPCDQYYNIFLDPSYVDAEYGFYQLLEGSPCVDAGDPTSPYDPDGTIADIGAYPLACPCGNGFWKHQCNVYLGGQGNAYYTQVELEDLAQDVFDRFYGNTIQVANVTFAGSPPERLSLEEMYNTMSVQGGNMYLKACSHFLPLLLNVVTERKSQFAMASEDGATVAQAIVYIHSILGTEDELAKDIAEVLNEGGLVEEGVIPLDTPILIFSDGLEEVLLPATFKFYEPFPNPFNPVTTFGYTLPEKAHVSFTVYDMLGRQVTTLVNGWRESGMHEVTFDAAGLASGVYVYHLTAGEHNATGKMVLMK
jgi:hypothetical protein